MSEFKAFLLAHFVFWVNCCLNCNLLAHTSLQWSHRFYSTLFQYGNNEFTLDTPKNLSGTNGCRSAVFLKGISRQDNIVSLLFVSTKFLHNFQMTFAKIGVISTSLLDGPDPPSVLIPALLTISSSIGWDLTGCKFGTGSCKKMLSGAFLKEVHYFPLIKRYIALLALIFDKWSLDFFRYFSYRRWFLYAFKWRVYCFLQGIDLRALTFSKFKSSF